ncbi:MULTISPECIES: phage head-tail adapter protein [unclassified Peribacillus]|uniref:phage head-tail adapter protein n=1 Tax=unclassified Peribacillus TaxID=2675266 RepID=UPI00191165B9|nr:MULTISPECIES: phage head-tail adapter protein [unclassified Peribacillus]MBK5446099.1 phage head-tail adapter protein [Peribacillus sp. TH24]WMX57480.1 phage head-tail adapter protein [Peribacillus sp. R9-11]
MQPFKYKPPRVKTGDLRTFITFYEYAPNNGPEPEESEKKILYEGWSKVVNVWLKDLEIAKSNGTLSDITITIRDPHADYIPTNKHYLSIDAPEYLDKRYNIKHAQPDLQNKEFITIVARLTE